MSLIPVFNKNLPQAHMESELDVLGVHGKLVKYVVHSPKRENWKKNKNSSHKLPKQQSTSFWSQGILGVNPPWSLSIITKTQSPSSHSKPFVRNEYLEISLLVQNYLKLCKWWGKWWDYWLKSMKLLDWLSMVAMAFDHPSTCAWWELAVDKSLEKIGLMWVSSLE
jgi:hypothetical protein